MFEKPNRKLESMAKFITVMGVLVCIGLAIYTAVTTITSGVLLSYEALITECLQYIVGAVMIAFLGFFGMTVAEICERLAYLCNIYAKTAKQIEEHEKERAEKQKAKEQSKKKPAPAPQPQRPQRSTKQESMGRRPAPVVLEEVPDDDEYSEEEFDQTRTYSRPSQQSAPKSRPQYEESWEDEDDEEDMEEYVPVKRKQPASSNRPTKQQKAVRIVEDDGDDEEEIFKPRKKKFSEKMTNIFFEDDEE